MLKCKFEYIFNNSFNEWNTSLFRKQSIQIIPEIEASLYIDNTDFEVALTISFLFFSVTGVMVVYRPDVAFDSDCEQIIINLNILPALWISELKDKSYLTQIKFLFWRWYIESNSN